MRSTKYTKELLKPIVKDSLSFAQVIKKLGVKQSGGVQQNIKRWIKRYELDTSHFLGQAANCGPNKKGGPKKKPWQEILILSEESDWRQKPFWLRRALIESGRQYVCEECGQDNQWRGKTITLQVNHKSGNWKDNRPDNLQFLCPNCHSVTEGWSGSKGKTGVIGRYKSGCGVTVAALV